MIELIAALATWRLTYMLHEEDGPFHIFTKMRNYFIKMDGDKWKNPESFYAQLFACFKCLSVWVSVPFAAYVANDLWQFPIYILGFSAVAIFLNNYID